MSIDLTPEDHKNMNMLAMQYLIFSDTKQQWSRSEASWLERRYVNAFKLVFPKLFEEHFVEDQDIVKKKNTEIPSTSTSISPGYPDYFTRPHCNPIIGSYLESCYKLEVPRVPWQCNHKDKMVKFPTWAVSSNSISKTVFYPEDFSEEVAEKWENLFPTSSTWKHVPAKFHYMWRNFLIPAHEIIHILVDTGEIYTNEWVASAGNLAVFLTYCHDACDNNKDKDMQCYMVLFALQGILYVYKLIQHMREEVKMKMPDIFDKWAQLDTSTDRHNIIKIVTLDESKPYWMNTYSKHYVALCYALICLKSDKTNNKNEVKTFFKRLLNKSILKNKVAHQYYQSYAFWASLVDPSNLMLWTDKIIKKHYPDQHVAGTMVACGAHGSRGARGSRGGAHGGSSHGASYRGARKPKSTKRVVYYVLSSLRQNRRT